MYILTPTLLHFPGTLQDTVEIRQAGQGVLIAARIRGWRQPSTCIRVHVRVRIR